MEKIIIVILTIFVVYSCNPPHEPHPLEGIEEGLWVLDTAAHSIFANENGERNNWLNERVGMFIQKDSPYVQFFDGDSPTIFNERILEKNTKIGKWVFWLGGTQNRTLSQSKDKTRLIIKDVEPTSPIRVIFKHKHTLPNPSHAAKIDTIFSYFQKNAWQKLDTTSNPNYLIAATTKRHARAAEAQRANFYQPAVYALDTLLFSSDQLSTGQYIYLNSRPTNFSFKLTNGYLIVAFYEHRAIFSSKPSYYIIKEIDTSGFELEPIRDQKGQSTVHYKAIQPIPAFVDSFFVKQKEIYQKITTDPLYTNKW